MKKFLPISIITLLLAAPVFSQTADSSTTRSATSSLKDTSSTKEVATVDSSNSLPPVDLRKKSALKQPTLPRMQLSDKDKTFNIQMTNDPFRPPEEKTNWDAMNMPTNQLDYEVTREYIQPKILLIPLDIPPDNQRHPLLFNEYVIPTRQELDILEVLWTKENVMDTTLYSCLDSSLTITMEDLNALLNQMTRRGLVFRQQKSPRNEFNAFGIMIEMSMQNRRNRIYEYRSNVDREIMRRFINANAFLFKEDSTIINHKQLQAIRGDKTLLEELNTKIYQPQK